MRLLSGTRFALSPSPAPPSWEATRISARRKLGGLAAGGDGAWGGRKEDPLCPGVQRGQGRAGGQGGCATLPTARNHRVPRPVPSCLFHSPRPAQGSRGSACVPAGVRWRPPCWKRANRAMGRGLLPHRKAVSLARLVVERGGARNCACAASPHPGAIRGREWGGVGRTAAVGEARGGTHVRARAYVHIHVHRATYT